MVSALTTSYRRLAAAVLSQAAYDADKGIRCQLAIPRFRKCRARARETAEKKRLAARLAELTLLVERGREARKWLLSRRGTMHIFAGMLNLSPDFVIQQTKALRIGEVPHPKMRELFLTPERKSRVARRSMALAADPAGDR